MKLQPIGQLLRVVFLVGVMGMGGGLLHGQNPLVKQWDKRYGGTNQEHLRDVKQTNDNGYLVAGYSCSQSGGDKTQNIWGTWIYWDGWIIKIDSVGNKQWDKSFGGTLNDGIYKIELTSDNGCLIGGFSDSDIGGDKSQNCFGDFDYWLIKIDSLGNKQWDKIYGGSGREDLSSILQTPDGGFILSGTSQSYINGNKTQNTKGGADYWIVKIDSNGIMLWDKDFGGIGDDQCTSLVQAKDGGYLLGGISYSSTGGDRTQPSWDTVCIPYCSADYWIIKTDSLGNKLWDKAYGGFESDQLYSILSTNDEGYILAGYSSSNISGDKTQNSFGSNDYWIVKIDSLGNKEWDRNFGGTGEDLIVYNSILSTVDGGYLLQGSSTSPISGNKSQNNWGGYDYWVIKIDSVGNLVLDKDFGAYQDELSCGLLKTSEGGYMIYGKSNSSISGDKTQLNWDPAPPPFSTPDYWIVKLSSDSLINNPIVILSSTDTNFCEKHCIDFYDLSTNNPTSWQWFFPGADSTSSTLQNPTNICYNSYGSFDVMLIACNAAGCDTLILSNFINAYPLPAPVITASFDTLFSSPAVTYQWWSISNGIITGANNYYYISTQIGDYFVIVTDSLGCEGISDTVSITAIIPSINLMSSDTTFCEKHCINFFDFTTNNPTSWQWFFPGSDSTTSTMQNPTNICYSTYGSFDVTLIACNAAGCDTLVLSNFINEYPAPVPVVTQSNDTLFSTSGVSYQWWSVDSGIITGANNYYYIPTQGGSYYVIVTDSVGCEGASNTIIITGISQWSMVNGELSIIPNPNEGSFTITLNENIGKGFSVCVINSLGQTIYMRQEAKGNRQSAIVVNMGDVAKGLYYVELITSEKVYRQNFLKE